MVAGGHGPELLELAEAALYGVAFLVPAGVEGRRAAAGPAAVTAVLLLVLLDRDDRLDAVLAQPGAVRPGGVRLIGHRAARPPAWPAQSPPLNADRVHQRDEPRGVTMLARAGQPRNRTAAQVSSQVNLGRQPAPGPADRLPAGFPVIR